MKRLLALLATSVLAATALVAGSTASASALPVPEDDPFYAVPANIASYADGAVIASRRITAIAYLLPIPADAWQILYKTNDSHGVPTATVTTLMVPRTAWKGAGTRPLVSYQTAEDGVAGKCAPSYGLRGGLIGTRNASDAESGLMLSALSNGWAVAAPDYEGPDSQFLAGKMEGQAILDGLRAALAFSPAGLSPSTKLGIWGYSGGAFATSIASQLQASYAPELNVSGVALGGVVAEIRKTIDDFSGSAVGGAIAMGVNGPMKAFPEYNLGQYLSASGRAKVAAASGDCIADAVARYPFLSIKQIEAFPGALDVPVVANLLHANSPLGIPGTPTAPVYDYHATFDELAPVGPDRELMHRYCDSGQVVEHVEHLLAEHISETVSGAPGALTFFSQRFAGQAPKNTCATIPAP
ncbi:lipase family protein [Nocardioides marmorisolisilvae]|uniref:Lipase n=1 Tax=Nocardioides marmorisolisilvae TaxID=1542737 RepID=A0A3N0DRQ0_9ACTN|nr:lipase family protein [Nocardioides marmorisolisilvae]RNL78305.1 lipase [Nocardioides marmorisolisilvae]